MPTIRPYVDSDWDAILEICILAFTPVHESFERLLGTDLFALVYPDWKASNKDYLSSLTDSDARDRFLVAEENGSAVGFIHYEVDSTKHRGTIGINAVHPAQQSKGIGSLMYRHVLQMMRAHGMKYVRVDTGGDPSHTPARRGYEKGSLSSRTSSSLLQEPGDSRASRGKRAFHHRTRKPSETYHRLWSTRLWQDDSRETG